MYPFHLHPIGDCHELGGYNPVFQKYSGLALF